MIEESLAGLGLSFTFLSYYGLNWYVYRGFPRWVLRKGPTIPRGVFFSFDDGPHPKYTPSVLNILDKQKTQAAFFLIGKQAQKYPHLVKEIHQAGHLIGNHTQNHLLLPILSSKRLLREIIDGKMVLEDIIGESVEIFRPPRGLFDYRVLKISHKLNLKLVLWTLSSYDWRGMSAKRIVSHVKRKIKPGQILLFHDGGYIISRLGSNRENLVKSLPLIFDLLPQRKLKPLPFANVLEKEIKTYKWQKNLIKLSK